MCIFQDKRIVVYSKSTDHSSYREKSKTVRDADYVSVLTIRPFESFDRPGIEFSLTAFENPGLSLPSSITTWVALRAMPEFMANLRKAGFIFGHFLGGFLVTTPHLDNVTEDHRYSQLLADFPCV